MFEEYYRQKRLIWQTFDSEAERVKLKWISGLTKEERKRYDKYQRDLFLLEFACSRDIAKITQKSMKEWYEKLDMQIERDKGTAL